MQNEPDRSYLRLVVDNTDAEEAPAGNGVALGEKLLDYIGAARGLRVIEFTYGPSRLGWRLQAAGCRADSIDLALYPIDSVPLEWMGQFDMAVITCALHQIARPDLLLADIASCVRPGGQCGGVEPAYSDFEQRALLASARSAGLSLVDISELETNAALFWKGQVPSLHILPRPAAQAPSFMPLAA
jgi:SAM-dependent methyltransferase